MDRYSIEYDKNWTGATIGARIIDKQTGNVVQTLSISQFLTGDKSREQAVGDLKRAANAAVTQMQGEQNQELGGDGVEYDSETGLYTTEDGRSFESIDEARDANLLLDRKAEFDADLEEYEDRIKRSGAMREELAGRIQARQQGQLLNQLTNAILGSGGDQAQIAALTPQIQEGGQRSLQDYITRSQAQTESDLAGATQLGIKGDLDLARLDQGQQSLTDAMTRFTMGEETRRAGIQAELDAKPEWWENIVGQTAQLGAKALTSYLLGV